MITNTSIIIKNDCSLILIIVVQISDANESENENNNQLNDYHMSQSTAEESDYDQESIINEALSEIEFMEYSSGMYI